MGRANVARIVTERDVVLTDSDHGRRIEATTGQKVVVRLTENPTTGYRWSVERLIGPVELSQEDFELPDQKRLGAGGARVLIFRTQAPGTAEVSLALSRSGGKSTAAEFEFTVEVVGR